MKILKFLALPAAIIMAGSCSHDPVYPSIGSLYVSTDPAGAEILIDGQTKNRLTPAKIDGITVGWHTVSLRYYRCKEWKQQVEIKPAQTRTLIIKMTNIAPAVIQTVNLTYFGVDMDYAPEARKLFIANKSSFYLTELTLGDSTIISSTDRLVGSWQYLVAASEKANRIYAKITGDSLAVMELTSGTLLKKIPPPRHLGVKNLTFSPDGQYLYAVNSADSSIFIYQTGADTIVKILKLKGEPNEVVGNLSNDNLYVTFDKENRLARVDASTGDELAGTATGTDPMGLFWDLDYQNIGVCNSANRTLMLADALGLGGPTSPVFPYGSIVCDACYSANGTHLWVLQSYPPSTGGDPPPPPGRLALIYKPTWQFVGHYDLGLIPLKIAQSPDGRFIYVLNYLGKDVRVFRTDLMN
ncbi:MAG: PEGA domain-containing protein [Candidatus Edwardsbacteria bacterium]|nr:PEGA domain-containing protein [Candidatus Edwardsbacteria bacterium]MBU1577297.1 PEGA domain-containing protein [Candidatus Edwardsbacteria bacterium]MBU2464270.1 PEGA domain-containing protein [Candidatus Edwardsbacteria bacterium]MBU2594898.1 PEGA domain-containing protein [Candidatus Edwardsbacteria bacterium]